MMSCSLRLLYYAPSELPHQMASIRCADMRVVLRVQLPAQVVQCAAQVIAAQSWPLLDHRPVRHAADRDPDQCIGDHGGARDHGEVAMACREFGKAVSLASPFQWKP